jgi:AcrR family transcriptional regulator
LSSAYPDFMTRAATASDDTRKGDAERHARRRKNDPAAMRARILDAAFDLFQEQGYNASSVHQIAARAAVTGGAFHHHFPTKKALGLAVIEERVATAVEETWLEPVRSAATGRDGILGVLEELARQLDAQGSVRGCPVNNLTLELAFADEAYRAALRNLFDGWRETIADKLGGADADALATMAIASYSGAMAIAKVEQRGEPLRVCAKELERLL